MYETDIRKKNAIYFLFIELKDLVFILFRDRELKKFSLISDELVIKSNWFIRKNFAPSKIRSFVKSKGGILIFIPWKCLFTNYMSLIASFGWDELSKNNLLHACTHIWPQYVCMSVKRVTHGRSSSVKMNRCEPRVTSHLFFGSNHKNSEQHKQVIGSR